MFCVVDFICYDYFAAWVVLIVWFVVCVCYGLFMIVYLCTLFRVL